MTFKLRQEGFLGLVWVERLKVQEIPPHVYLSHLLRFHIEMGGRSAAEVYRCWAHGKWIF